MLKACPAGGCTVVAHSLGAWMLYKVMAALSKESKLKLGRV